MAILNGLLSKLGMGRKPAPKRTPVQIARELEEKAGRELKTHMDDLIRASKSAEDALRKLQEKRYG
jgi:hypothetical protein